MSQFFASGGQSIGVSAPASVLLMNIQGQFPLGLIGLISLQSKELSRLSSPAAAAKSLQSCLTLCNPRDGSPPGSTVPGILQARTLEWVSSPAPQFKSISSSTLSLLYGPTLTSVHGYWKNHSFDYMDLCQQVYSKS